MQPVPQDLLKEYVQSQHFTSTAEIMEAMKEMMRVQNFIRTKPAQMRMTEIPTDLPKAFISKESAKRTGSLLELREP